MTAVSIMNEEEVGGAEEIAAESGFGCVSTALGNLPVKALDVKASITGLVYASTVRQTYVNGHDNPLEATYIFPLPDRAAVRDFRMFVGKREVKGELKERGEARRVYDQAIQAGHRASIVEEERPNTFTMRVGNVEPGEEVTIEFTVTGPLVFADNEATFRFPLVVAPRYIPGNPLEGGNVGDGTSPDTDAVPDASRISPPVLLAGFQNPIELSIACDIDDAGLSINNVRSSLHAITTSSKAGRQRIEVRPGERVNRDFILRFDVGADSVTSSATFVRDSGDYAHEGTFAVTLVPPTQTPTSTRPRDVVFLLDQSGSMGGWKMVAARRALGRMLDTLTPRDRFEVILFQSSYRRMGSGLREANNRNRYRAIEELAKVEAGGGTQMAQPIFDGLDMLCGGYADRQRMLVLVTDGQVGNEDQIVVGVRQRAKNVRFHTVGIDQAVNAGFLNRLADIGGGRCELVESEDRLDEAMDRIHRTIDTPVLTELSVQLDNAKLLPGSLAPERLGDLFAGAPVLIFGRFTGSGAPAVRLSAANADGSKWSTQLTASEVDDAAITAVWARGKVRAMEDRYIVASTPSLSQEITEHSLRFGVLCRFTSWVAVDQEQKIETTGDLHRVLQPVDQPAGWAGTAKPMRRMSSPPPPGAPMAAAPSFAPSPGAGFDGFASGGFGAARSGAMDAANRGMSFEASADAEMDFDDYEEIAAEEPAMLRERREPVKAKAKSSFMDSLQKAKDMLQRVFSAEELEIMSPEQADGQVLDARTDVFLLGVAAFEILTGRTMLIADSPEELADQLRNWSPTIIGAVPELSPGWRSILLRALAKNPADRYASPAELLSAIEQMFGTAPAGWPYSSDQTLSEVVRGQRLTDGEALRAVANLARAVAASGHMGVMNRSAIKFRAGSGEVALDGHPSQPKPRGRDAFWK